MLYAELATNPISGDAGWIGAGMLEMEEMAPPPTPFQPPEDKRFRQLELDGMRRYRRR